MDKISIIVPIYNAEKYLSRCIESIINQTYKNLDIILVDDGSLDRCGEICDEYAESDSRVRVIHKNNEGVSSARNAGLDAITGEYVTFIDADDYVSEKYIETLYKYMDSDTDMVISNAVMVSESGGSEEDTALFGAKKIRINDNYDFFSIEHREVWGVLIKKVIIGSNRFKSGLYVGEDALFYYTMLKECKFGSVLNEKMYYYVMYDNSAYHGGFDPKKYTEIYAWQKIAELFSDMPDIQTDCYAEYIRICLVMYDRIKSSKYMNKHEYVLDLQSRVRKTFKYIKYIRSRRVRRKAYIFCMSPEFYNLLNFIICNTKRLVSWRNRNDK